MVLAVERKKLVIPIVLAGLVLGLVAWYYSRPLDNDSIRDLPVEMEVENFELIHGSEGRKAWRLKAERSRYDRDAGSIKLVQPRFVFFRPEDDSELTVSSRFGRLEKEKGNVYLRDKVRARYEQARIRAERMEYDDSSRELMFSGGVHITYPEMQARSQTGVFDLQSKTLTLWRDVTVQLEGGDAGEQRTED